MSFIHPRDSELVKRLFRLFYETHSGRVFSPTHLERREFGYAPFGQRIMIRHLSFSSAEELRSALRQAVPMHVYRSAAIYQLPSAPMEEKGWTGAELIFDIDADHLETRCRKSHDFAYCVSCLSTVARDSKSCPTCGANDIRKVDWVCEDCVGAARAELMKLVEVLENDFNVSTEDMTISFSGNRGYHLAVNREDLFQLSREARQEIVDYVTGANLDVNYHGLIAAGKNAPQGPQYTDSGWRGRIARTMMEALTRLRSGEAGDLKQILAAKDIEHLSEVGLLWLERPRWELLRPKQLRSLIGWVIKRNSSTIDTVVTTDLHRLLRLANTLNGKTGLTASIIPYDSLQDFDPFIHSVGLPSEPSLDLKVLRAPEFTLGGNTYGPYEDQAVRLPTYVGAYLLCRGVATTVKG